ncbi:N-acetyldiaminopimelate deacetylase [Enterococcus caccae]|uniref:N-acetyldiaminopimelate deacetylase n=1 Tax=Enterococcus caccae ATCC BAA-1240 TaxID=1158612 RepID=R3TTG9_9ENTE|nr:N-acetyldiaminopimelate deacetylase [Enterococcus caccae]EOL44453.1 amidohydrolase [Enterococcus caccae ATCC BAA-1240]EOT68431.1 M20/M25/M40 family peptidase [Enterococcus caccae ATCC BAA-1240]OJG28360.1 amidohydrolase [Enterococcus caccae]
MIQEQLIEIRRQLHQIPEIGLEEEKTHKYLLEIITSLDKDFIEYKTWRTGIMVFVHGKEPKKTIGWRADMDGLPITEEVISDFQSTHKGYMHACGHDFHMTIGLGLLEQLTVEQPENNYLFLFQPAEENEAGGMLMYEAGAFGSWLPDEFYGLHVNPELPVGKVTTKVGTLFAATCEVQITLKGKGGHAAFPHASNDMIVAGMSLVQQAQTIVSRNVNPVEGAVVTFGTFNAGSATNVIAGEATISGTIRTLTEEMNQLTQVRIREIGEGISKSFNCEVVVSLEQKGYLPVINNKQTTETFISFMQNEPNVLFEEADVAMTGEDFGYLLSKVPGTMFWLGVDSPFGLHSAQFNPKEEAIPFAVEHISNFLRFLDK